MNETTTTHLLQDLIARRVAALHVAGSVTYCWDGDTGTRHESTTGITTLVTTPRKLPTDGWRPLIAR